jgi:hypothetical protein
MFDSRFGTKGFWERWRSVARFRLMRGLTPRPGGSAEPADRFLPDRIVQPLQSCSYDRPQPGVGGRQNIKCLSYLRVHGSTVVRLVAAGRTAPLRTLHA